MADEKKTDLKAQLMPVQDSLATVAFHLRTARNRAETVSLGVTSTELMEAVNALGQVIKRVDAISAHLRKIGEAK